MFCFKKLSLLATCILGLNVQSVIGSNYQVTPLVANLPLVAPNTDPNLINPWGLFFTPTGNFWVADNGSNVSTLYRPDGSIIPFVINVAGSPTQAVLNPLTQDFLIGNTPNRRPAIFLFATESGTILGFNPAVDPSNAVVAADRSANGAIYKSLDIARNLCADTFLFATDFHNAKIDLFDTNFNFFNSITDPTIPAGYAPFNVRSINGVVYVTYAKQQPPENKDDQPGLGNGYVDIFLQNGTFAKRLISNGVLNSPWGLALAPSTFGDFAGALLVGNFGDGLIHAYNISTGALLGTLTDAANNPIQIDGLWALVFDAAGTLYFTSGPNGEQDGLVGTISLVP